MLVNLNRPLAMKPKEGANVGTQTFRAVEAQ